MQTCGPLVVSIAALVSFSEKSKLVDDSGINTQLLILIGASAGALVVILITVVLLVNRYHRHKNRKLVRQLSEKM